MGKKQKKTKTQDPTAKNPLPSEKVSLLHMPPSKTDPLGSYTGKPQETEEVPTQDADDL